MAEQGGLTPADKVAVARTVEALRHLVGGPSEADVMGVLQERGWARRQDESGPHGRFFGHGIVRAAVNSSSGQPFVTFRLGEFDDDDGEYTTAEAVLHDTARDVISEVTAAVGAELEEPDEEFEEPAMDFIEPYYRQLGPWVFSMGLVHLESDEPVLLASRMTYWSELDER